MRGWAIYSALVASGLAVVATAATALSVQAPTPYNQSLTLAGGEAAIDPDAPISTARYGDAPRGTATAPSPIDLAGAPSNTPLAGEVIGAAPDKAPRLIAEARPPREILTVPQPRQGETRAVLHTRPLALTSIKPSTNYAAVAKLDAPELQPFVPVSSQSAMKRLSVNASALMGKSETSARDSRRGRWMLFAASSGKALGLNLIRDSLGGWRGAGWSQERLARYGTHQLGLGWRKDNKQISLSAARRKLSAQDFSEKDVVYGVTLSIKPR